MKTSNRIHPKNNGKNPKSQAKPQTTKGQGNGHQPTAPAPAAQSQSTYVLESVVKLEDAVGNFTAFHDLKHSEYSDLFRRVHDSGERRLNSTTELNNKVLTELERCFDALDELLQKAQPAGLNDDSIMPLLGAFTVLGNAIDKSAGFQDLKHEDFLALFRLVHEDYRGNIDGITVLHDALSSELHEAFDSLWDSIKKSGFLPESKPIPGLDSPSVDTGNHVAA